MLELPYNDPRELVMEVMRHGASVEVLAPQGLRDAVVLELEAANALYQQQPAPPRVQHRKRAVRTE